MGGQAGGIPAGAHGPDDGGGGEGGDGKGEQAALVIAGEVAGARGPSRRGR